MGRLAAGERRKGIRMLVAELIVPVAWAGACHLAMWTVGSWIRPLVEREDRWRDEPAAEREFLSAMLGFAVLGTVTVILGCLRLLYAPLLIGGVAALAAAGAIRLYRRVPRVVPQVTPARAAAIVAALGVLAYVPGALHPVLEWDENVYHLLLAKRYLAEHALVALPWNVYANMPHQIDLAYVAPFAIGGIAATRLFVLGFVLWTVAAMGPTARRLAGEWGPAIATLLYLSGPNVRWHLGVAYVEPVLGALLLGAALSLAAAWGRGSSQLRTFAILVGTACASKYTAWLFAAVLFAAASVSVLGSPGSRRRRVLGIAGLAAIAAVPLAPWLVKNAIVTGNPLYPSLFNLFGGVHWSEIQTLHMTRYNATAGGVGKSFWTYLLLPFNLVFDDPKLFFSANFAAGLMALFLAAMCLPWRRGDVSVRNRLIAVGGFAAWAVGVQQGRFLVAWIPVMVVTACHALAPLRRFSWAPVVLILSIVGLTAARYQRWPDTPRLRFDVFQDSREELLRQDPTYELANLLNRIVPPGGTVLGMWEDRFYRVDHPSIADGSWESPVILAALRESGDADAFARKLASAGVTHVVINYPACERFVANNLSFDLLDDRVYPAARLQADIELLHRFVREYLEPVPWDGAWPVFRLKNAGSERFERDQDGPN
jgi:hypothetical protein